MITIICVTLTHTYSRFAHFNVDLIALLLFTCTALHYTFGKERREQATTHHSFMVLRRPSHFSLQVVVGRSTAEIDEDETDRSSVLYRIVHEDGDFPDLRE